MTTDYTAVTEPESINMAVFLENTESGVVSIESDIESSESADEDTKSANDSSTGLAIRST